MLRALTYRFLLVGMMAAIFAQTACDRSRLNERMNMVSHKTSRGTNSVMGKLTKTRRNYNYLKKSGGLVVKLPVEKEDGTFFLPVYADLSGSSNGAERPNVERKMASVRDVIVEADPMDPSRLYLHIITAWRNELAASALVQGVNLGALSSGVYTVEYQNRDGSVTPLTAFKID